MNAAAKYAITAGAGVATGGLMVALAKGGPQGEHGRDGLTGPELRKALGDTGSAVLLAGAGGGFLSMLAARSGGDFHLPPSHAAFGVLALGGLALGGTVAEAYFSTYTA